MIKKLSAVITGDDKSVIGRSLGITLAVVLLVFHIYEEIVSHSLSYTLHHVIGTWSCIRDDLRTMLIL